MLPGFNDPAVASHPTAGNLYFEAESTLAQKDPGETQPGGYPTAGRAAGHALYTDPSSLMFGGGGKYTSAGEAVVGPAVAGAPTLGGGSWKEVLNFHGSPAPWVLIGILLVAGILHLQAGAGGKLGKTAFGAGVRA